MDKITILVSVSIILIGVTSILQLRNDITINREYLNKIAEKLDIIELTTTDDKELNILIQQGKKIKAIKRYRKLTGVGLKEAKEYIDKIVCEYEEKSRV